MSFLIGRDPRKTSGVGSPDINELERRVQGVVQHGRVKETDYAKGLVRVGIGDEEDPEDYILTDWLPMQMGRSNEWNPVKVGEAVVVLSEGGDIPNGVVMPAAINNTDNPAKGDRGDLWRKEFDGGHLQYDEASGELSFEGAQRALVKVAGTELNMTESQAVVKVGGATITVTDSQIVLSAGGQTFVVGGGGAVSSGRIRGNDGLEVTGEPFAHNGVNVGDDHRHKNTQPGSGLSGEPNDL